MKSLSTEPKMLDNATLYKYSTMLCILREKVKNQMTQNLIE